MEDEEFHQLVLPESLQDITYKSYHDDLGHQGRDRTLALIKQRFYWPGMTQYVHNKVQQCAKCNTGTFLCSQNGEFNENSESKCIHHVYLERLSFIYICNLKYLKMHYFNDFQEAKHSYITDTKNMVEI